MIVAIISHRKLAGMLRIAGCVQKMPSFAGASSVSFQCGKYTSQTNTAPANAPSTCAIQNGPTLDQFFERIATASVIAGLICAPGLPHATAVQIPATTAIPQAVAITIQPELSPLDFFSKTLATTPSPNTISTRVPMNSPRNGPCMVISLFRNECHLCPESLLRPIKAARNRLFPEVIQPLS